MRDLATGFVLSGELDSNAERKRGWRTLQFRTPRPAGVLKIERPPPATCTTLIMLRIRRVQFGLPLGVWGGGLRAGLATWPAPGGCAGRNHGCAWLAPQRRRQEKKFQCGPRQGKTY
jgi:hypothetical protein